MCNVVLESFTEVSSHRLLWWTRPGLSLDPRTLKVEPFFVRDEGKPMLS